MVNLYPFLHLRVQNSYPGKSNLEVRKQAHLKLRTLKRASAEAWAMLQWRGKDGCQGTVPAKVVRMLFTEKRPLQDLVQTGILPLKDNFFFCCLLGTQNSKFSFQYVLQVKEVFYGYTGKTLLKVVSIWKNGFWYLLTNQLLNWKLKVHSCYRHPLKKKTEVKRKVLLLPPLIPPSICITLFNPDKCRVT